MSKPKKPKPIYRKRLRIEEGIDESVLIQTKDYKDSYHFDSIYIEKKDLMRVAQALIRWALYLTPPDYKEK